MCRFAASRRGSANDFSDPPPSPDWFRDSLDLLWELTATRDFGPEEMPLSLADGRVPFGANYAVRAIEQRQFLYDINLGPGTGRFGDEVSVIRSLLESGCTGYWVPEAIVYHMISVGRQTTEYVVQRYKARGATNIYLSRDDRRGRISVIMLALRVAVTYLLYVGARTFDLQPLWLRRLKGYAFWRGALEERLRNRPIMTNKRGDST